MMLRGDHCRCFTCGEHFNSTYAFDKRRTGTYQPMQRRCFTAAEMRANGHGHQRDRLVALDGLDTPDSTEACDYRSGDRLTPCVG